MKFNMLIIDDNKADIRLVQEALSDTDFPVEIESIMDGDLAIDYLNLVIESEKVKPNLILLDLNMPSIDGFEILERIKANEELKRIPIIIFTSSDSESDLKKSYDLHANAYLVKPFNLDTFIATISSLLDFWGNHVKTTE